METRRGWADIFKMLKRKKKVHKTFYIQQIYPSQVMEKLSSQANKSWGDYDHYIYRGNNAHGDPAGWNERTLDRDLKNIREIKSSINVGTRSLGDKNSVTALRCPQSCWLSLGRGDLTIGSFGYCAVLDSVLGKEGHTDFISLFGFSQFLPFLCSLLFPLLLLSSTLPLLSY